MMKTKTKTPTAVALITLAIGGTALGLIFMRSDSNLVPSSSSLSETPAIPGESSINNTGGATATNQTSTSTPAPATSLACPTISVLEPVALYNATGTCLANCSVLTQTPPTKLKPKGNCSQWIVPGPTNLLKEPYCSERNGLSQVNRLSSEPSPYTTVGEPGYWAMPNAKTNRLAEPYWVGCMNNMPAPPSNL